MAFGQASGPPAGRRQVEELAALLAERGYDSFREARHPFGLTQRQAAGNFTVAEAAELLESLEADGDESAVDQPAGDEPAGEPSAPTAAEQRDRRRQEELVVAVDAEVLATE